jgi:hypothetical protein
VYTTIFIVNTFVRNSFLHGLSHQQAKVSIQSAERNSELYSHPGIIELVSVLNKDSYIGNKSSTYAMQGAHIPVLIYNVPFLIIGSGN